jgi:hypothetical protein
MAFGLSSFAGCVMVSNLALNLGKTRPFLASLISVSPQSINVDYQRAWFFWPTIVYVRQLRIRGSDVNVQWQVEVDAARLSVDLTALIRREFHATKVLARGVGFRLRQKVDAHAATRDRFAPLHSFRESRGFQSSRKGHQNPTFRKANTVYGQSISKTLTLLRDNFGWMSFISKVSHTSMVRSFCDQSAGYGWVPQEPISPPEVLSSEMFSCSTKYRGPSTARSRRSIRDLPMAWSSSDSYLEGSRSTRMSQVFGRSITILGYATILRHSMAAAVRGTWTVHCARE